MNLTWLYVGTIYGLTIGVARRAGIDLRPRIALFFYLLVLIFMWHPMIGPYVNLPVDFILGLPPWYHVVPKRLVVNSEMNDLVMQIVPWAHQARQSIKSLHWPLWNPYAGSGYPLLANGQSAPFSLLRLVALPLPLGYAMTAEAAMKLLIAVTFTYLLCRRRNYGELPSAAAAVCFGFSTFLHVWLHFPIVTVACFLPAALYQLDLLAERVTHARFACTAMIWTAMLYGGHPETVSHATFLGGLYLAWIVLVEKHEQTRRWRQLARPFVAAAAAIVVAALIALPFILPFLEALPRSKRYQELREAPNVVAPLSDFEAQVVLFQPYFYGRIPNDKPFGSAAAVDSITGFAGILGIAACLALLLRAVVEGRFREREFFFVLATLLFLGVILGWPGIASGFHAIFRLAANARLRLMLCFLLAMQAGAILDVVLRPPERGRRVGHRSTLFFLLGLLTCSATMLALVHIDFPDPKPIWLSTAVIHVCPSMIVIAVAALMTLFVGRAREAAMMLVTVVMIAELWGTVDGWNPALPREWMYPRTPMIDALDRLRRSQSEPFRIVGIGPIFFPNVSAMFGFEDIRAHDPMANGRYLGLLRVRDHYDTSQYFANWNDLGSRTLDFLNTRYVLADTNVNLDDARRFRLVYAGRDGRIFENRDVLPRFYPVQKIVVELTPDRYVQRLIRQPDFARTAILGRLRAESTQERSDLLAPPAAGAPEARLTITHASATDFRMRVFAPRWTLIVSSVPSWPGWRVVGNGKPLQEQEANGAFLAFVVPPGDNDVRVVFAPTSFRAGGVISILTMIGLFFWKRSRSLRHYVPDITDFSTL